MLTLFNFQDLRRRIHLVRGHRVLLQHDLAQLYGAAPDRLLARAQQFPGDLCFPLEHSEIATISDEPAEALQPLYAFTEHGSLAVAYALDTPEAIAMSIHIVRTFVHFRQAARFTAPWPAPQLRPGW